MKTTPIFKILSAAILLAVVFYFAVQGYHYFSDPINTTFVYASHEWDAIETEGYLVREEETFHSDMTTLHHALKEGEKVGKNQTLAIAFPDSGALNRVERLDALEMQAQQLSFALESFLDGDAALKLDDNIREDLTAFHQAIATGDYTRGEDERTALKTAILKRDYTYTSQEQIEFDLNAVEQKIKEEEALLNGTDITAPKSGIFSAICDGYERVLTPALLGEVSPSFLTTLQPEAQRANVGKLIYGDTWYYVTVITQEQAQLLEDRTAISVQFAKGFTAPFAMSIKHISEPENGKCVLWLSTREYMAQTTLLRQQSADDQTKAPVQPAADGGDEGGDDDGLLLVVSHVGDSAQSLLTGLGRSHGVTKHQNQSHLHGEGQQTPEALVVAPCVQHRNGTHAGSQHSAQEDDDGQDHSEQEGVRQPTVDYAYAAICELFEHSTHSFFCF